MSPVAAVENLSVSFGDSPAIEEVSFTVNRGEIIGLVGESGSGKSVTGFSIMRLLEPPGRITGGRVMFDGRNLAEESEAAMRRLRGNRIAMIFQDPMMTLNPVLRIDTQMIETVLAHDDVSHRAARERSRDALGLVGIPSPEERLSAYPHEFSGGMRQRVAIAIAMLHRPDLIIADEPTTALDVTIQAQILFEAQKLARDSGTAMIWISHDLSVVAGLAQRLAVMYAGRIVELGDTDAVLDRTRHPYAFGLIRSVPSRNARGGRLYQIPGTPMTSGRRPGGCPFHPRCANATVACLDMPAPREIGPGHEIRCHHPVAASPAGTSA